MRTPKPTVAASKEPSSNGSSSRSPCTHSTRGRLARARARASARRSRGRSRAPPGPRRDREVAGAAAGVEHAVARPRRPPRRSAAASAGRARRSSPGSSRRRPARSGRTSSGRPRAERAGPCGHSLAPPAHERVLDAELVEAAPDDEVDEIVDASRRRGRSPARRRGSSRPACRSVQHVLQVDRRERRLARHEHELPALLERDRRGPVDQVRHRARGDRAERAHRARADRRSRRPWPSRSRTARASRARRRASPRRATGSISRASVSSGDSRASPYSSVASTSIPAREAQTPISQSAAASASQQPRRVRSAGGAGYAEEDAHGAYRLRALRRLEEDRELAQVLLAEILRTTASASRGSRSSGT